MQAADGVLVFPEVEHRVTATLRRIGQRFDAVDLEVCDGRLLAWKPAFGGQLVAAIRADSPTQMATVRVGVFAKGAKAEEAKGAAAKGAAATGDTATPAALAAINANLRIPKPPSKRRAGAD